MSDDLRFENRMSDADALMWVIEKDPVLRSTITAVIVLDQAPDRQRLIEFRKKHPLRGLKIKDLINEGRKY